MRALRNGVGFEAREFFSRCNWSGRVVVQLGRFRAAIPSRTAMPGRPVYGGAFARLRALRREQRQLEARGPRRLVEAAHCRCIYYRTCTAHAATSPRASGKWGVKVQRDVLDVFPCERRCRSLMQHRGALLYGISARALRTGSLRCEVRLVARPTVAHTGGYLLIKPKAPWEPFATREGTNSRDRGTFLTFWCAYPYLTRFVERLAILDIWVFTSGFLSDSEAGFDPEAFAL